MDDLTFPGRQVFYARLGRDLRAAKPQTRRTRATRAAALVDIIRLAGAAEARLPAAA
jgi:hypothetical protein